MKVFIVLLYIWKGEVTFQKRAYPGTIEECAQAGYLVLEELLKDPRFDYVLFARCVALPAQEVKK